jgi:sugar phosphate isomerase/epimerase
MAPKARPGFGENEIRERLGVTTWLLEGNVPFEIGAFEEIYEAGIRAVEIAQNRGRYREEDPPSMVELVRAIRGAGLRVSAFHARGIDFGDGSVAACNREVERAVRMIDHMIALGGRVFGTHVKAGDPAARRGYEMLARHFEGMPVKLVIENRRGGGQSVAELIELVDSIDHPNIGILFDVSHERDANGMNPMATPGEAGKIIRRMGPRALHLHLHDCRGALTHLAPFDGDIQWAEIFEALAEIGYGGDFVFEVSSEFFDEGALEKVGSAPARIAGPARRAARSVG